MAGKKEYEKVMNYSRVQHRVFEKSRFKNALELIKKRNILQKDSKVVDYGCGALEFLEILQTDFKVNQVYGGNIEIETIKELGASLGITLFEFDGEDVNSTGKQFERFFDFSCLATLEHVFDVDSFMQIIFRNSKDEGYFILSVPNIVWINYYRHALKGGIPWKEGHHVRFFNLARIKQYIIQNGFSIVDQNHITPRRYFFQKFLYKRIRNDSSLIKNIFIKEIVFLTKKDKNFYPIGVAKSHHNKETFSEIDDEQKMYMLNKIKNELLKTSCISSQTYNYLTRLLARR